MAIDTRSKRASSVQILMPFTISPVLPDGTISQGDRQHIAWAYSGINAVPFDGYIYLGTSASTLVYLGTDAGTILLNTDIGTITVSTR